MDVDANSQEDELSTTSSSHALRKSTSLRAFRDTSRQSAASRQQHFAREKSSQPAPTGQDDLPKMQIEYYAFLVTLAETYMRPKTLNIWLSEQCRTLVKNLG